MNLYITVVRIVSRVKELGIGIQFDYGEVNQWLGISSGDDLMWSCDKLSDRLIVKHRISLELDRIDGFLIDANVFPGPAGA